MWRTVLPLSVLFGLLAAWPNARAQALQCRLCSADEQALGSTANVAATPVAVEVQTSLEFDRLVLTGPSGGIARLEPDGSRATSGALSEFSGRAMAGSVAIRGEPNRLVRVDLPTQVVLEGLNGGRIIIERISSDLPSAPRIDPAGRLSFRFGGELRVQGDAEGDYRGEVPITVEYL
ncbi:DUF4402 domain-containing protein [Sphingomonas sp. GCM10030256]|uniref:DUF4402 domain-containing protein n=1 Tax=Sphingomonas sp. GCM10030256 TaxID=3273427 RepID=UPI00360C33F5